VICTGNSLLTAATAGVGAVLVIAGLVLRAHAPAGLTPRSWGGRGAFARDVAARTLLAGVAFLALAGGAFLGLVGPGTVWNGYLLIAAGYVVALADGTRRRLRTAAN